MQIIKLVILSLVLSTYVSSLGQSKEIKVGSEQTKVSPVENRYAFIIGIDHYKDPDIQKFTSCRIDALKFESYLKSDKGWKMPTKNIVQLLDPKKETIISAFSKFLDGIKSPKSATVYFYFSGHGVRGSIVPADYFIDEPQNLISYDYIKSEIEKRNVQAKVFILDACYSGSIITMKGDGDFNSSYTRFIQDDTEDSNQVIFTATSNNRTTPAGKNVSVFTYHLLRALENTQSDTDNDKILSSGELYTALLNELKTSNPPQFAGSKNFPMAYYKKITDSVSNPQDVSPIATDYSTGLNHGPFSIERDGIGTNWGYVNANGEQKIPFIYKNKIIFHERLAKVKNNEGLYGYINKAGETIIPFVYDFANDFSEGLAAISYNGEYGFIDKYGMEVMPFNFYSAGSFSDGLSIVKKYISSDQPCFINKSGNKVTKNYNRIRPFSDGLAAVQIYYSGSWGYIDKTDKFIIPSIYKGALSFSEGLASVRIDDNWAVINTTGKIVIQPKKWVVGSFHEGKAPVYYNSKYGFINRKGDPISPFIYEEAAAFSDGLAAVKIDDKWGYLDSNGQLVIKAQFKYADQFENGYARIATFASKTWIIDTNGKCVFGCLGSNKD